MNKKNLINITINLSIIIFCINISCAGPNKLSQHVKDNVKYVSVSSDIYFYDDKLNLLQIEDKIIPSIPILLPTTKFGLLTAGIMTLGGIVLSIDRTIFLRNLLSQIREAVGDTIAQVVKRNIYNEFISSFDQFDTFKYIDDNPNKKADAELVIEVNSFGYAKKISDDENVYPFVCITCYLIEPEPIPIEPSKHKRRKSPTSEPPQYRVLWKDVALSMGSILSVKDLLSYPAKVEDHMKEASKNTAQVIFCSMLGIKAY